MKSVSTLPDAEELLKEQRIELTINTEILQNIRTEMILSNSLYLLCKRSTIPPRNKNPPRRASPISR